MTRLVRDPQLVDNIVEVDFTDAGAADEARRLYEQGALILLRGLRFDLDLPFLNSVSFDVDAPAEIQRKIKKYDCEKIATIRPDSTDPIARVVFEQVFGNDRSRLAHFQAQVKSGNEQIVSLYKEIFPGYRDYRRILTWRFTETLYENLHWDNFHLPEVFHQVRIFYNVDRHPRLWRIAYDIDTYSRQNYVKHDLGRLASANGDDLALALNRALGGVSGACLDGLAKHHIAFEQGDIWLCETRIVSHQIYCGHRAVAAMFFVDPATMDDPNLCFDERVRRIHRDFQTPSAPALT